MDTEFVLKHLKGQSNNKATGLDSFSAKILKISADKIAESLCNIFNLSISSGIFPEEWKIARVGPNFKAGSKQDVGNFRPISILPIVSKIIEKHVHIHLYNHVQPVLNKAQSGFRKFHSCETALIKLSNMWLNSMDNNDMNGVVFFDLRKAFDLVDYCIFLEKLSVYMCDVASLKWFKSYLNNRSQLVQFKNSKSQKLNISSGVPFIFYHIFK
jgi:hypothetical protein